MADVGSLIEALIAIAGEAFVRPSPPVEGYDVDGCAPWAVVSPGTIDEVAAVLALAHREGLAVTPWGGGTAMAMGRRPERLDVVLSLHRLHHLVEHEPADLVATAQAGITVSRLQTQLGSRGQWWPLDPPHPEAATLGGVLATNASGPKRFLYGTARDLVIGLKVVHADGTVTKAGGKVTKNVTGYDMTKLYIGSLGTLAVIVEATLKLRPLPPVQQVVWATFPSAEAAWRAARQLLSSPLAPNAVELVNAAIAGFLQRHVAGPDRAEGWSLLVGVDGVPRAVARQVRELEAMGREAGLTAWWTDVDDGRLWRALQARFRPQGPEREARLVVRLGTVRTQVLPWLARLAPAGAPWQAAAEFTARLGNGLIYASLPCPDDSAQAAHLVRFLTEVRAQLAATRGYLVVESAPAGFKAQFDCWGDVGPQAEVMGALKCQFDPQRVLNPGRFVNGL
jgi:glycolate oxidase FAD binding subunit